MTSTVSTNIYFQVWRHSCTHLNPTLIKLKIPKAPWAYICTNLCPFRWRACNFIKRIRGEYPVAKAESKYFHFPIALGCVIAIDRRYGAVINRWDNRWTHVRHSICVRERTGLLSNMWHTHRCKYKYRMRRR